MTQSTTTDGARCPACAEAFAPGDHFCEACGAELPDPKALCAACGGIVDDGYCLHCGLKKPAPRDHLEQTWPGVAALTDKGKRHYRNEDAFALGPATGHVAAVVCDGVSMTVRSDEASQLAVDTAVPILVAGGATGLLDAYHAARSAVLELPFTPLPEMGAPSCTYLAAVVTDDAVTYTSMGDCRIYWVAGAEARLLNTDDSVAAELVRAGELTPEAAPAHKGYHVVTRWIAADADPAWEPAVETFTVTGPGRVVMCSDGLWNYTFEPGDLLAAMGDLNDEPLVTAQRLCAHALAGGGHDNITVVVIDVPLAGGAPRA